MASCLELVAADVGCIALLFIDGDRLENVLLDKFGHTDYDFDNFNALKKTLMKVERINPSLDLTAVLWQLRPDNPDVALPVVCGNAFPMEGWQCSRPNAELRAAFDGGICTVKHRDGCGSHYFPVKNSDAQISGVLELLQGKRQKGDI
jgi:hypothetical protein